MLRTLVRFAPTFIGVLLIYAGIYKLAFPGEATYALEALSLKYDIANALIVIITVAELYLGRLLLLRIHLRFALTASTVLFFVFTCFLWYLATLAHPPGCGCLGFSTVFKSNKSNAVFGIMRNCLILWMLKAYYDFFFKVPVKRAQETAQT